MLQFAGGGAGGNAGERSYGPYLPAVLFLSVVGLIQTTRSLRSRPDRRGHELVIVGKNRRTSAYLEAMERYQAPGVKVVGLLDCDAYPGSESYQRARAQCDAMLVRNRIPHLGTHRELTSVLKAKPVDEVLITLPIKSFYDEIGECLKVCQEAGIPVSLSTDFFGLQSRPDLMSWGASDSRLTYCRAPITRTQTILKRGLDIAGASIAIAIFAVPMALIALAIKLSSRGPVFFVQERIGQSLKPFKLRKFRTMIANAEQLRESLCHLNEQDGPVFKIRRDPRVTWCGRLLRKFSLDELPQLFNVLVGEMSLVGPRPPIRSEVEEYEWWQRRRLSRKPGLTCYWQVEGRNRVSFEEWMRLDLKYIDDWSLWTDIKLLLRTVPAILRGSGV
ncbi:MAG: exopolysaccharide biosynthesis polyprenyl glycosylphosphotransferase [Planctomycetes bacterium]|nr:exopolysaccharide biosynthesis polyprenyl glycosylphosphotransferase [Planctomycetota bacterium]